jgi:phospholipid-translocating ATPase
MVKLFQGFFINWDLELYDEPKDRRTVVNTSNLNEEIGQISVIFSDKTGTLTCNKMDFNKICISGDIYGGNKNKDVEHISTNNVEFTETAERINELKDEKNYDIFLHLASNHSINVDLNNE